jgi:hypothetical protein
MKRDEFCSILNKKQAVACYGNKFSVTSNFDAVAGDNSFFYKFFTSILTQFHQKTVQKNRGNGFARD